jgi:hypothetical protein
MKASIIAAAGVFSTAFAGPVVEKRQQTVTNAKTPPVSVKGNGMYHMPGTSSLYHFLT